MKDRVPVNPGRVLITPENGSAAFYATMTRADNPTQEGTPLNKSSLLKDATAALFGLGTDAVPDDVLAAIKTALTQHDTDIAAGAKIATGSYVGTGYFGAKYAKTLTFNFKPGMIIIYKDREGLYPYGISSGWNAHGGLWLAGDDGADAFHNYRNNPAVTRVEVAFDENTNTLSWYADSSGTPSGGSNNGIAQCALNGTGATYHYIAISQ